MIKAIVFDVDDTLYQELDYVKSGFKKVAKLINGKFSLNVTYEDLFELFLEDPKDVYNRLLDKYKVKYEKCEIQDLIDEFRDNKPDIHELKPFTGTEEVLRRLQKKYKLGIITDGRVSQQENKIESLDIAKYFGSIVCSDKFGIEHRKPDILPFETISKELNVSYENMMYIGDNRAKDFAIKKFAPVVTVEMLTKNKVHDKKEYLYGIEPDYKIKDISKLENLLEIING